jgi:hypothetical protein
VKRLTHIRFLENLNSFQKILFSFLMLRAFSAIINCFLPFDLPHIIRQTDSIAVSMRYWSRWLYEDHLQYPLYPAVLNSGQSYGFMPMEFPLLAIVTAPFHFFGPYFGKVFCCLFICFLILYFIYLNFKIWKDIEILGLNAGNMILLMPIFSFSASISWRFMPDFTSLLLCLTAVGLTWNRVTYVKPFLLATLGLLLKPVTIILFPIYLLNKNLLKNISNLIWIIPSILIALLYYTKGVSYLNNLKDIPNIFGVHKDIGFSYFIELFSDYKNFIEFINYHPMFPYGLISVSIVYLLYAIKLKKMPYFQIWVIIFLQTIIISVLDGKHSLVHFYYWFGTVPSFCLLALGAWELVSKERNILNYSIKLIFFSLFTIKFFELCYFDIRLSLNSKRRENADTPFADCYILKKRNPQFPWKQGYVFFSENTEAPYLGVCFAERTNYPSENLEKSFQDLKSTNKYRYGFLRLHAKLPENCYEVDRSGKVILVQCE